MGALGSEGISEGSVLKRATLDLITRGLQAQYSTQGRYGASVEVNQKDRPRNRVEVSIDIDEGTSTAISSIEIIGNTVYEDSDLKRIFELSEGSILSYSQMTINIQKKNFKQTLRTSNPSIKIEDISNSQLTHHKFP